MYSSREPSELSQWLCYDDSTKNIVVVIIVIIILVFVPLKLRRNYYYYYYYEIVHEVHNKNTQKDNRNMDKVELKKKH